MSLPLREHHILEDGAKLVGVHPKNENCERLGCAMHSPSDHPLNEAPKHWLQDPRILEAYGTLRRECPCGNMHPDADSVSYVERAFGPAAADAEAQHVCCGCCAIDRATVQVVANA